MLGQIPTTEAAPPPEDVAAWYVLDRVPLERVPWWAAEWLTEGYDGELLRELAGEHGDDPHKIKELLVPVLREMGVQLPPDLLKAADRAFDHLARLCLQDQVTERAVSEVVAHVVAAAGFETELYALPLGTIYGMDDEWEGGWGRTDEVLRADVRRACEQQLAARQ